MKVFYEGTDISKRVSVAVAWHDMFSHGKSDELTIKFNDTRQLWDGWNPQPGDEIGIEDAAAKTGVMYVESVKPESSLLTIHAMSMPLDAAKVRRVKSWEKVQFSQLVQEICSRYGLGYETYGVQDQTYDYVEQQGEPDYMFLDRRCAYEGCGLLTYDGKIVVYDIAYMESQGAQGTLPIKTGMDYEFTGDNEMRYGRCEVRDSYYTGTYESGAGKLLLVNLADRLSSQSEADRFAKGLLTRKNQNTRRVKLITDTFLRSYAPMPRIGC